MVPQSLLNNIHVRLQQIHNSLDRNSYFRNVNIFAVGDFHQIPPVKGQTLYKNYSVHNVFLFHFSIFPLTQIMRQQDDLPFAEFLNRIRLRLRTQPLLPADLQLLQNQCKQPTTKTSDILHVFARNVDIDQHNQLMLASLPSAVHLHCSKP